MQKYYIYDDVNKKVAQIYECDLDKVMQSSVTYSFTTFNECIFFLKDKVKDTALLNSLVQNLIKAAPLCPPILSNAPLLFDYKYNSDTGIVTLRNGIELKYKYDGSYIDIKTNDKYFAIYEKVDNGYIYTGFVKSEFIKGY